MDLIQRKPYWQTLRVILVAAGGLILTAAAPGPSSDFDAAAACMSHHDFQCAIDILDPLLQGNPQSEERIYRLQIEAHTGARDLPGAALAAEMALRAYPKSLEMQKRLGLLLFQINPKDPRAGEALGAAAAGLPRDPEIHHFFGQWSYINHKQNQAVDEETRALALAGTNDLAKLQINLILGLAQDQMGQPARADAAFRRAMDSNRRLRQPDPMAAFQYVQFLDRNGRPDEAAALAQEILHYAPQFGPARLEYAKELGRKGNLKQAAVEAERALPEIGDDPELIRAVHYFLAKTWMQLKEPAKAQPHTAWIKAH